jgi:hypothetical protein
MFRVVSAITLATVVLGVASSGGQTPEPRTVEDPEAYAVYASLLPKEWPIVVARATRLVIQRETATYDDCLPQGPPMQREWSAALKNYRQENATVRSVLPGRALGYPYEVVPRADIVAIFEAPDGPELRSPRPWDPFYRRYPDSGGYMQFSAVGFDEAKTRALVYIAHHCGNLCGGGTHHFLEKVSGQWRETRPKDVSMCMWMS